MEAIRNFVIIAHIDHGKSTLADRFLELTETIPREKMRPQFLDMMDLEREKGITIKMRPVRMSYVLDSKPYILNLIDTPGHIDFSYEVSRSLAAVEGAILLVDATKGIQAQTIYNLELAQKQNLKIIPAVNKIDLPQAQVEENRKELAKLLKVPPEKVLLISAKTGINVEQLLRTVIRETPSPGISPEKQFRALIFDSQYDPFKGILAFVRVFDGEIKKGEKIYLMATQTEGEVKEVGIFDPQLREREKIKSGEIGYVATGVKEPGKIKVGDTIIKMSKLSGIEPLAGYKEPTPMIFAGLYPENADNFELLKKAISHLKLNDAALTFEEEAKELSGRGFRCGFLGTLHAEIVSERLRREFGLNLIISRPQAVYKIIDKTNQERFIYSAKEWPKPEEIQEIQEPWVKLEILTPPEFFGVVSELLKESGGILVETKYLLSQKLLLIYEMPLREIIVEFYEKLKGISKGFASMNYEILGYQKGDLVRLEILIAGGVEETFSQIVPRGEAYNEGRRTVQKLKELLPPQLFAVSLQAQVAGKIIARETMKAKRRDVTAPLYGGDYTRKRKLLEKQKKRKKRVKRKGED